MTGYNPNANLYNPRVGPDTQGLGPGIAAAGDAFAGALKTYGQNKRQDAVRAEDRQWQQQDHSQLREEQLADYGMRRGDMLSDRATLREQDLADYGMRRGDAKADKEEERNRELEDKIAHYGTTAGLYASQGFADPDAIAWAATRPPKEQAAAFEAIVGQASFKAQQTLKQQLNSQLSPLPQSDGYQMTGNGQLVPPAKPKVAPLTPEQLADFGLKPQEVKVGGVTYRAPVPPKEVFPVLREDPNGNVKAYDRRTGAPLAGESPPVAPSFLQNWTGKNQNL